MRFTRVSKRSLISWVRRGDSRSSSAISRAVRCVQPPGFGRAGTGKLDPWIYRLPPGFRGPSAFSRAGTGKSPSLQLLFVSNWELEGRIRKVHQSRQLSILLFQIDPHLLDKTISVLSKQLVFAGTESHRIRMLFDAPIIEEPNRIKQEWAALPKVYWSDVLLPYPSE